MQYRRSRQDVTGLIVNIEVGVKRETIKRVRTQVESVIRVGSCHVDRKEEGKVVSKPVSLGALNGHLAHIAWVKGRYVEHERGDSHWMAEPGYVRTYRKFLDHQAFVASTVPTIICEGKTDNVYLRCAIKEVAKVPTNLVDTTSSSGLGVRLFKFTNTTSWVQRLGGGTGDIKNLIGAYAERANRLNARKFQSPVILVVDNDAGASKGKLNSLVKEKSGSTYKIDGSQDFYHLGLNLYLVYTPKTASGGDTMIEDFLPSDVRKQKLGKKTLELDSKKFDPAKNFGKVPLADSIVRRQSSKIDFSGYLPLLHRISEAIGHFEKGAYRS